MTAARRILIVSDYSYRFDEIAEGYQGPLYVEIVPLSFAVRVRQGLALNQLRLMTGRANLGDDELRLLHAEEPLLYIGDRPATNKELATGGGLFLSLDLGGGKGSRVGYRAREHTLALDVEVLHLARRVPDLEPKKAHVASLTAPRPSASSTSVRELAS